MSKQVTKRILIAVCLIILVSFFAYRYYRSEKSSIVSLYNDLFLGEKFVKPNPNFLKYYPENRQGTYQFDPYTILASLEQGQEVFTAVEPDAAELEYDIGWTQSDFLRVTNALSQKVWHEPLDLNGWSIYNISFVGYCQDNLPQLDLFDITYYKTIKTGWEMVYAARRMIVFPRMGTVEWARDGTFSTPFIFGWENIEFAKFKTTVDEAVQIAEEYGAKAVRVNGDGKCSVHVFTRQDPNRNYEDTWDVDIAGFSVFINPFTGDIVSIK